MMNLNNSSSLQRIMCNNPYLHFHASRKDGCLLLIKKKDHFIHVPFDYDFNVVVDGIFILWSILNLIHLKSIQISMITEITVV